MSKELGSPPFINHKVRPFGRGTMVMNRLRPSWDDPPLVRYGGGRLPVDGCHGP